MINEDLPVVEEILEGIIEGKNQAHAYLFVGPRGLGKTKAAVRLAQRLLGTESREHPDLLVVCPEGGSIKIGEVRNLEYWLKHKPYLSERKVVVIARAHAMLPEAANALLKTLEEPPKGLVFILTADRGGLLPTIVSRCQVIRFAPFPLHKVLEFLENQGIDKKRGEVLAFLSQGSPGRALELADIEVESIIEEALRFMEDILRKEKLVVLETAESLEKDGLRSDTFLLVLEAIWRDALLECCGGGERALLAPSSLRQRMAKLGVASLKKGLQLMEETRRELEGNANKLLMYVNLFFRIADMVEEG